MTTPTAPLIRQYAYRNLRLTVGLAVVVLLVVVGVFLATRSHTNPRAATCEAGWRRYAADVRASPAFIADQHGKWVQTCKMGFITP